jgi:hypothetical protein
MNLTVLRIVDRWGNIHKVSWEEGTMEILLPVRITVETFIQLSVKSYA